MKLYKQIKFSGTFQKGEQKDDKPIKIESAKVSCFTNGIVVLELDSDIANQVQSKILLESIPSYEIISISKEDIDYSSLLDFRHDFPKEKFWEAYNGSYKFTGLTDQGLALEAIACKTVKMKLDSSTNPEKRNASNIITLKKLKVNHTQSVKPLKTKEVIYGITGVNLGVSFSFKITDADLTFKVSYQSVGQDTQDIDHNVLSAELRLSELTNSQDYDKYSTWVINLISLASGCAIDCLYKIKTIESKGKEIQAEYWSGNEISKSEQGISVIEKHSIPDFMIQCSKKIKSGIFENKRLGLALAWYVNNLTNKSTEVRFLTLYTALESLTYKYKSKQKTKIMNINKCQKRELKEIIQQKLSEACDQFREGPCKNPDGMKEQLDKIQKRIDIDNLFDSANNTRISKKTFLKEFLECNNVVYTDLNLFSDSKNTVIYKIRNDLVHQGVGENTKDLFIQQINLSNLLVRFFLAILEYQGYYMEYKFISDSDGEEVYFEEICRTFPITPTESSLE